MPCPSYNHSLRRGPGGHGVRARWRLTGPHTARLLGDGLGAGHLLEGDVWIVGALEPVKAPVAAGFEVVGEAVAIAARVDAAVPVAPTVGRGAELVAAGIEDADGTLVSIFGPRRGAAPWLEGCCSLTLRRRRGSVKWKDQVSMILLVLDQDARQGPSHAPPAGKVGPCRPTRPPSSESRRGEPQETSRHPRRNTAGSDKRV